jgi:hypothetical protein
MCSEDTADRTIRNHRCGIWPASLWPWTWFLFWVVGAVLVAMIVPSQWHKEVFSYWIIGAIVTLLVLFVALRFGPVERVNLGTELTANLYRSYDPDDIIALHFAADPAEDYADVEAPVRVVGITVELSDGRNLRLVVSTGDAARLREWSAQVGVLVIDPDGYSTRVHDRGTNE